jgi:EmrB/QacA subfamily drug resistance transporter
MQTAVEAQPGDGRRILIAFIVATAFVMQGIDSTLLIIAIPTISEALAVNPLLLHLAVTAYLLSLALFMPVSGWFADRIGNRTMFCVSLLLFTLGSVLAGIAPGLTELVAARVVQGIGGAMMTPIGRLIVLKTFGPGRTLDAMAYMTLPMTLGPLLGPLIGASIISVASWRWLFFVNVPICLAAVVMTLVFVPHDRPRATKVPFDFLGFIIGGATLIAFQLSVEHLATPIFGLVATVPMFALTGLMLLFYVRHARRTPDPALDISLFSIRSFNVSVFGGGLGRIGLNSGFFLVPLLLQIGLGMNPLTAAAFSSTAALGAFASKPLLHFAIIRYGYAITIIALSVLGAALTAGFALVALAPAAAILIPYVIVVGATRGMYFNVINTLTYAELPSHLLSKGVSSGGVFQQLAMGLGVSVSAAVLTLVANGHATPDLGDFSTTFLIMAVFPLLSLPMIFSLRTAERAALQPGGSSVQATEEADATVATDVAAHAPSAEPVIAEKNNTSPADEHPEEQDRPASSKAEEPRPRRAGHSRH